MEPVPNHKTNLPTDNGLWASPVMQSMALKKGKEAKWKPRWLRLLEGLVLIFSNQGSPLPSAQLNLAHYCVAPAPTSEFQNAFCLTGTSAEWATFHFAVPTPENMQEWLQNLKKFSVAEAKQPLSRTVSSIYRSRATIHTSGNSKGWAPARKTDTGTLGYSAAAQLTAHSITQSSTSLPETPESPTAVRATSQPRRVSQSASHPLQKFVDENQKKAKSLERPKSLPYNQMTVSSPSPPTINIRTVRSPEKLMCDALPSDLFDILFLEGSGVRSLARNSALGLMEQLLDQAVEEAQTTPVVPAMVPPKEEVKEKEKEDPKEVKDEGWKAVPKNTSPSQSGPRGVALGGPTRVARTPEEIAAMEQREEALKIEKLKATYISKLNPYDVYDLQTDGNIGKGSVGEVVFAAAKDGTGVVAIKKLQTNRRNKDRLPFILREIEIIATTAHPNIVRYIDCFDMGPELWVAMEYMSAGSLYDIIKLYADGVRLAETDVSYITNEVLVALDYMHGLHRIHRDIKVDNVLLSLDGSVKLADFGTAVQLTFQRLRRTTLAGTPYYMAPELIQRLPYGEKVDIWSVGISIIELLEGEPPFYELDPNAALDAVLDEEVKFSASAICTSRCRNFVEDSCLQRDPAIRWSAKQLLGHEWLANRESKEGFASFLHDLYGRTHLDELKIVDGKLQGANGEDPGCIVS